VAVVPAVAVTPAAVLVVAATPVAVQHLLQLSPTSA
jgi:hypothetical protein